jgi:hypothetical protein
MVAKQVKQLKKECFLMKKVPDDKCKWCKGSGREDHYPCPDCEGTGFKHGKQAVAYQDYQIGIMDEWHTVLLDILVETFGFPAKRFIPKDAVNFVMNYFAKEEEAPQKEATRLFMIEELGEDFFLAFRPMCYGHVLKDKRILIYLSLLKPPVSIDNERDYFYSFDNHNYNFNVRTEDCNVFLQQVNAEFIDTGVIQFSKEAWKSFPSTIPLKESIIPIR